MTIGYNPFDEDFNYGRLDDYKQGFKEGVVAVQTQLKEVNLEFQLVGNKYSQADIKAAVNGFYKAFMQKLDEICKELVDE